MISNRAKDHNARPSTGVTFGDTQKIFSSVASNEYTSIIVVANLVSDDLLPIIPSLASTTVGGVGGRTQRNSSQMNLYNDVADVDEQSGRKEHISTCTRMLCQSIGECTMIPSSHTNEVSLARWTHCCGFGLFCSSSSVSSIHTSLLWFYTEISRNKIHLHGCCTCILIRTP